MEAHKDGTYSQRMKVRVYGSSAACVRTSIQEITGVELPKKKAIMTQETGRVFTESEFFSTGSGAYCDCSGGDCSGGDGDGLLLCLIVIAVLMIMVAVVWAVVMIAFSILTVGGFLKRRYRTVVVFEKLNREFMGKLAVSIFRKGGVIEFPFGYDFYDEWVRRCFSLHMRLKNLRQVSLFFGLGWGWIEVIYKLGDVLLGYGGYNLWPLRIPMIFIFVPLLLYSPILEIQFDNAFRDGEEMIVRLLNEEPGFSPDYRMSFNNPPEVVAAISSDAIRKLKYDYKQ